MLNPWKWSELPLSAGDECAYDREDWVSSMEHSADSFFGE